MKKRILARFIFSIVFISGIMILAHAAEQGLSGGDVKFMKKAASGGMMEVQLGEMAQQKAQSPDVKNFAKRMVTDHGAVKAATGRNPEGCNCPFFISAGTLECCAFHSLF